MNIDFIDQWILDTAPRSLEEAREQERKRQEYWNGPWSEDEIKAFKEGLDESFNCLENNHYITISELPQSAEISPPKNEGLWTRAWRSVFRLCNIYK